MTALKRLNSREEFLQLALACKEALDREKCKILVCGGTGCVAGGSLQIFDRLQALLQEKGLNVEVELAHEPHGDVVGMKKSGCHGFCEMGPLVRIEPQGWLYTKVKLEDCEEIVEKTVIGGENIERLAYHQNGEVYRRQEEIPFYKKQTRVVLEHCGHINATSVDHQRGLRFKSAGQRGRRFPGGKKMGFLCTPERNAALHCL